MTAELDPINLVVARLDLEWKVEQRFKLKRAASCLECPWRNYPRSRFIITLNPIELSRSLGSKSWIAVLWDASL